MKGQNFDYKIRRDNEKKKFYKRRAYELVEDENPYWVTYQKSMENQNQN